MDFRNRIKHAWNAFMNKDPTPQQQQEMGIGYATSPIRTYERSYTDRSMINAIFNRISMDVSLIEFLHVRVDDEGHYLETLKTPLNECLNSQANIDQTGRGLIQDAVSRMLKRGYVGIVPVEADDDPDETGTYDIYNLRCVDILEWYPRHVKVRIYNDHDGKFYEKTFTKEMVAIIQNPMYDIMNEPNSILQRIYKKLSLLDVIDNENASTKLNMIVQVPYNTKSVTKQNYAQKRIDELEEQLANSPRGIGYMDINEHLIQLNRPLENNLLEHIKYLTDLYKGQLGINDEILNGTANEILYNNYSATILEPICLALCEEMRRKWLTKTARTKGQSIIFFRDPFRNIPTSEIAKIADVLSRNQIMTPNELRQKMGMKPSQDPKADELNNANMPDNPGEDNYNPNEPAVNQNEGEQAQPEQAPTSGIFSMFK